MLSEMIYRQTPLQYSETHLKHYADSLEMSYANTECAQTTNCIYMFWDF